MKIKVSTSYSVSTAEYDMIGKIAHLEGKSRSAFIRDLLIDFARTNYPRLAAEVDYANKCQQLKKLLGAE